MTSVAAKPLRILALVTEAYGGRGGIAQYNRDLLQALSRDPRVHSIDVLPRLCPDAATGAPPVLRQHPATPGRFSYSAKAIWLAQRLRPDVILCGHLYMAPLAAMLARCAGAKLIVQVHGIEIWRRPGRLRRMALDHADLIFCVSRDTRRHVLASSGIPPERVLVIPNTFESDYVPGEGKRHKRQELGVDHAFVLLSVGRLDTRERYKGHDRIIEILPELLKKGRDIIYLIGGDGDDRRRLENLAKAVGVSAQVFFLGQVLRKELPDLYRAADLFVLPSTGEGFGIVFLEAMACGTAALGLAAGGADDPLSDGELGHAAAMSELPAMLSVLVNSPGPDPVELAARVRRRFGRDIFEQCVLHAMSRLWPSGTPHADNLPRSAAPVGERKEVRRKFSLFLFRTVQ